jgi:hypothetical protein
VVALGKPSLLFNGKAAEKNIFAKIGDQVVGRYTGKGGIGNIAKDMMMLRSMMNTENKHIDSFFTSTACINTTGGLILQPTFLAEGSDDNQRTGRSVKLDRIDCILSFNFAQGSTGIIGAQVFRWFLVKWLKCTSSTPMGSVAQFLNVDGNSQITPLSLPNTDTAEDWHVLQQGIVTLTPQSQLNSVYHVVEFSTPVKFHQTYSGSAANTIEDGSFAIIVCALNTVGTAGVSNVQGSVRMLYIDN